MLSCRSARSPLLIRTTGDAYPDWTFEHFLKVAAEARPGHIVVLQFGGVDDFDALEQSAVGVDFDCEYCWSATTMPLDEA